MKRSESAFKPFTALHGLQSLIGIIVSFAFCGLAYHFNILLDENLNINSRHFAFETC